MSIPEVVLQVWKFVLVGFVYLFFLVVLRAVWSSLRADTAPAAAVAAPSPKPGRGSDSKSLNKLKVLEPAEMKGVTYDLADEITIGRAPGCRISLDDTFVSQLHARVFRRDGQAFVEDLGSTNGTLCNGKKVSGAVPLKKGDKIKVGRTTLEVQR